MTEQQPTKQLLGTGLLSWPTFERITGRYGTVALFGGDVVPDEQQAAWDMDVTALIGKFGCFIATLDGKELDLGAGTFFVEEHYDITYVGLEPTEKREEDWLNITNLRKVDGFIVNRPVSLYFIEVA